MFRKIRDEPVKERRPVLRKTVMVDTFNLCMHVC